jgi:hypothetical protein
VPDIYSLKTGAAQGEPPIFVDAAADQYRAAILQAPGVGTTEYLLWAQNTSQLALVDDPSWWTNLGDGTIPEGTLTVVDAFPFEVAEPLPENFGFFSDGTDRVVIADRGNRDIGLIFRLVVARGDFLREDVYDDDGWEDPEDPVNSQREGDPPFLVFDIEPENQSPSAGIVRLTNAQLAQLSGGLSQDRGDRIVEVIYTAAPARFWWTRNDRYEKRFGWNGQTQRWEPFKGGPVANLGRLAFDTIYQLDPKFGNLPINAYLPGDAANPDSYAMIRLGTMPSASSQPVAAEGTFTGIRVKASAEVEAGFDFSRDPNVSGVLGQTNGILEFNPRFTRENAGKSIWYVYQGFVEDSDGIVGNLKGADNTPLFIAPVPGPTDYPFIRLGSRRPLIATLAESDLALEELPDPDEGEVQVSLSTGRLRLSAADIAKADPTDPSFDKQFLGEVVIYSGLALNQTPQPTKAPVPLVGEDSGLPELVEISNKLYIPNATYLPDTASGDDIWRGLGKSGILDISDMTGAVPAEPNEPASVRPGGDTVGATTTGRIRKVTDGTGDAFLFHWRGALLNIVEVNSEDDLPSAGGLFSDARVGTAYVSREASDIVFGTKVGSRVELSREDRKRAEGKYLYFSQATVTPATYTTKAQLISKSRKIFRFEGTETLYFAIDGSYNTWNSATLVNANPDLDFFTAEQVAESIDDILVTGRARALNERVLLESLTGGSVEIGFGTEKERDLSGAARLGFLPGWRAVEGITNWLPDSGASFGVFRSPVNLDRSNAVADFNSVDRFENITLQESVSPNPFVFLDNVPLQDIAGFDEGVFFNFANVLADGDNIQIVNRPLEHFKDVVYKFGERKFDWVDRDTTTGVVQQPITTLPLGKSSVVPESLLGAPGIGGGLFSALDGSVFELLDAETQYVLPQDGLTGEALLIERFGDLVTFGAQGTFEEGSSVFTDPSAQFKTGENPIYPGYRIKLSSGDARGSYIVTETTDDNHLAVQPPFRFTSERPTPWEAFRGFTDAVFDPGVIADAVYEEFNHLSTEPFQTRTLTPLGTTPTSDEERLRIPSIEAALTSERPIEIRFKLEAPTAANTAALIALAQSELGTLANDTLDLPDTPRLASGAFRLRIGADPFTPVGVTVFSPDPGEGLGVEYLTAEAVIEGVTVPKGRLEFGTQVLVDLAGSPVWYVEEFQDGGALEAGTAEYDTITGDLNFSQADLTTHAGERVYFVERMVTERRQDVAISPTIGSFSFNTPVQKDQAVEVEYFRANSEGRKVGDQITEFLPVFIQDEVAVKQEGGPGGVYLFNTVLRTVDQSFEPVVYVGPTMQNYGGVSDYVLDYPDFLNGQGRLTFARRTIADHIQIKVSYAVFEATGGELAYDASTKPLYRPPFFITENQDKFGLRGDRTEEFKPGQMLRVGSDCFYIRGTTYFPPRTEEDGSSGGDVTSVLIFPPTAREVGTRSPGNDSISVITGIPITTVVDPDGTDPIETDAPEGLMQTVPLDTFPFEPVTRGQKRITFNGDLTQFAVPGHVLEIGGHPFTIVQVDLNEDGTRTKITVAVPFSSGFTIGGNPTVKLSFRPVYPPDAREFLGVGPILTDEPVELVLFGEQEGEQEKPGRTLIPGIEYDIDPNTGKTQLLDPGQRPLGGTQKLLLSFTQRRVMQPFFKEGAPVFPRYFADFLYTTFPDVENGLLGGLLTATYTFDHPDSFYFRVVPFAEFLGEAAREAQREITARQPAGGPVVAVTGGTQNWNRGNIGLRGERRHLTDKDRGARAFLSFYNTTVLSFEQILEAISGGLIGDRDGKFRFSIGKDKDYPPPGYEDTITGLLNPRLLWNTIFSAARGFLSEIWVTESDQLVEPYTATIDDFEIDGDFPDADRLDRLIRLQRQLISNDVDDRLLTRIGRTEVTFVPFPWFFQFKARGDFRRMGDPGKFSRIFPEVTKAFFYTYPGIGANQVLGDPGVYTWGRMFGDDDEEELSTHGKPIGRLANPVIGNITNVNTGSVRLQDRRARARIWGYFPDGIPNGSFAGQTAAIVEPCLIATPVELKDLPIDPDTGYPDNSQFLSEGGGGAVPDLVTGDPSLATPPFEPEQQLAWGQPDGKTYQAYSGISFSLFGLSGQEGLFIKDIQFGCVIRFADDGGDLRTNPRDILVATDQDEGTPADVFPIVQGDTIYVVPKSGAKLDDFDPEDPDQNPPSAEVLSELVRFGLPGYRTGFDVDIEVNGEVIDNTYPSFDDPFFIGLKEILGQNPPEPLTPLEGHIQFAYLDQNPLLIPALEGGERDDSGDVRIPYLKTGNTELDRFDEVQVSAAEIMSAQNAALDQYVYPDEVSGRDGHTVEEAEAWTGGAEKEPAALITAGDVQPRTTGHPAVNAPGIGNVTEHDLLLIQTDDTASRVPLGAQGILSVGSVETRDIGGGQFGSIIEPPRFVTQTTPPAGPGNMLMGTQEATPKLISPRACGLSRTRQRT